MQAIKSGESTERSFWDVMTGTAPKEPMPESFQGSAGLIKATMRPFSDGVQLNFEGKTLTIKPLSGNRALPQQKDDRTILYKNVWNNVDVEYQLRGEMVKEIIVVKNKKAKTDFDFKVEGGRLLAHPTRKGELAVEGVDPEKFSFSSLTLDVNGRGVISEERVSQAPTDNGLRVSLDKEWFAAQPSSSFPMRIDPSFYRYNSNTGYMYKSDGYSCNTTNCYFNVGGLYDNGWKYWRTYFTFDYGQLSGKKVLYARLQMPMKGGIGGDTANRWVNLSWANCLGFHCVGSQPVASAVVGTWADIDFTNTLQARVNAGDFEKSRGVVTLNWFGKKTGKKYKYHQWCVWGKC